VLVLAAGSAAAYAQAQIDPPRGDGARMAAEEQRERQIQDLLNRVLELKKEIEASQRVTAANPSDRELLERLKQRRMAEAGPAQTAKPGAPKPEGEGLRLIFNGQEVNLGEGKVLITKDGKPAAAPKSGDEQKRQELQELLERAQVQARAEAQRAQAQRGKAEGNEGEEGIKIIVNGREMKPGEGKAGEGGFIVLQEARPGQPAPGSMKPLPPGGGWQAVPGGPKGPPPGGNPYQPAPGAALGRPGAPLGQPGNVFVLKEGQEREGREAQVREPQERREGEAREGFQPRLNPAPAQGPNPRPGPTAWGQPMPGAPLAGPPVRPNPAEAGTQQIQQMIEMLHVFKEISFNSESAAMMAIGGIKDENPRRPDLAIKTLEGALRKTKTVGLRTAIHLTLKDLYKAQGNEEMVLEHLRDMILENDEALQEHKSAMLKKDGPSHKQKAGKKDKDDDDDDDD
jgi:hypothetical protein